MRWGPEPLYLEAFEVDILFMEYPRGISHHMEHHHRFEGTSCLSSKQLT